MQGLRARGATIPLVGFLPIRAPASGLHGTAMARNFRAWSGHHFPSSNHGHWPPLPPVGCGAANHSNGRFEADRPLGLLAGARTINPAKAGAEEEEIEHEPLGGAPLDWLQSSPGLWDRQAPLIVGILSCCEAGGRRLRVAVLLSGGVDSSLAIQMLHAAGHQVKAFYLQIWFQEDFRNFWDACPWEEDLKYAKQVCESLGVELDVVPLTQHYWDRVVRDSIRAIRLGLTPNPDILCNSRVKFGAFCEHLEAEHPGCYDRVASGHYARVLRCGQGEGEGRGDPLVRLAMTPDEVKDQTYFLAQLSQKQLSQAMFPLGPLTKREVRRMARAAGLATQGRKDSQGICFLGKVKFSEFVKEHLGEWPGLILEEETGRQLGFHQGFWFHTIGQRSGLLLPDGPWYVVRKDTVMNAVYVSKRYYAEDKARRRFYCSQLNWIVGAPPSPADGQIQCKVRHGPKVYNCQLHVDGELAFVELDRDDQGLAAGQYAVFYQKGTCFGCGVILPAQRDGGQLHVRCSGF